MLFRCHEGEMIKELLRDLRIFIRLLYVLPLLLALNVEAARGDSLIVLIPDGFEYQDDSRANAWVDAASEEGFKLEFMHDSNFMALGTSALKYSGFIMPDQIHQKASDALIQALEAYVSKGGKLMLVYDAGALTAKGFYPSNPNDDGVDKVTGELVDSPEFSSRFSDLVGVDYLLYEEFYEAGMIDKLVGSGPVLGIEKMLWQLQVPPGKSTPFFGPRPSLMPVYLPSSEYVSGSQKSSQTSLDNVKNKTGKRKHADQKLSLPNQIPASSDLYQISGYTHEFISYRSFVTRNRAGAYKGDVLLSSPQHGLVAGVNRFGLGKVLFVNLALSDLKGKTDGMLMHGFLRYFGDALLGLPRLANHPKGKGGLVFNWHVDYRKAVEVHVGQLDKLGVWDRGPYSIHFTAGPDVNYKGDALGMDLPNSNKAQTWLRKLNQQGHQVGSHGGWIHNYYGINASEDNGADFEQFLALNHEAVETALGRKATEYSAPLGNNPSWAMDWLKDNGILAYYFTGHTGMAPTTAYRDGKAMNRGMWAFPVSPLGKHATFEEFSRDEINEAGIIRWYEALMDFVVYHRTSRLIYAHPPGAAEYPNVIKALLNRADAYEDNGYFQWYTMTELANFMNERAQVSWRVTAESKGSSRFQASHPSSLKDQTWMLPKRSYNHPNVVLGQAKVLEDSQYWIVTADNVTDLEFVANRLGGMERE